ncbi:MAG: S1/P1 nuclease [Legionellales bacterium]|nr:S1/P1 nuclease [Legionellales bacterium]
MKNILLVSLLSCQRRLASKVKSWMPAFAGMTTGLFLSSFLASPVYAYNSIGHKVVAQIAYDNLTPEAKGQVETLITIVGQFYSINSFVDGAPWADWLKSDNVTAYNTWHYIDQPILEGGCDRCTVVNPETENIVWAIGQSQQVLMTASSTKYPQESNFEKSMFLLFFEHFVGDIHQPLHAVDMFSDNYPTGDQGGNLYPIDSDIANNLHSLWDKGAGVFSSTSISDAQIVTLAAVIEKAYPESSLPEAKDLNPVDWAAESKDIAQNVVYTIPANTAPTAAYLHTARSVSEKQAALAGYRLAALLNQYFEYK